MRSELVFGALTHVENRYLLVKLAASATRKLHRPNTRVEETTNYVLTRFSHADPRPVIDHSHEHVAMPEAA